MGKQCAFLGSRGELNGFGDIYSQLVTEPMIEEDEEVSYTIVPDFNHLLVSKSVYA